MRINRTLLALSVATGLAAACAPPPPPPPDVAAIRSTIEAANKKEVEGFVKGDTALAASNYADDAILMFPNDAAWRGRASILKGFAGMFASGKFSDGSAKTEDVMVAGDMAVETGSYQWTFTPTKGKPTPDKGKYLTTWKKQADGSWKIVRDASNSDLPAPK